MQAEAILTSDGTTSPGDVRRAAHRIYSMLLKDPLLQRYHQHYRVIGRNTEPWQALGEQRLAALALSRRILDGRSSECVQLGAAAGMDSDLALIGVASALTRAVPYLWLNDIDILARSMPVPAHSVSPTVMPFPYMFFSFETGFAMSDQTGASIGQCDWMLCIDYPGKGIQFVSFGDCEGERRGDTPPPTGPKPFFHINQIQYGDWPPENVSREKRTTGDQLLARLAFINSPYTDKVAHRLNRAIRRDYERAHLSAPQDLTYVVTLRRRETAEPLGDTGGDGAAAREWRARWWVSGHLRNQWYPSTHEHKLIWVAPYVKGPDDKPLARRVYAVAR